MMGDHGGCATKLAVAMSSAANPNSSTSILTVALFDSKETPEAIRQCFGKLFEEYDALDGLELEIEGVSYIFETSYTGDLKYLRICLGLSLGNPTYYCVICDAEKPASISSMPIDPSKHTNRNYGATSVLQHEYAPLIHATSSQIRLPVLHLTTGIIEKILKYLVTTIDDYESSILVQNKNSRKNLKENISESQADTLKKLWDKEMTFFHKAEGWKYILSALELYLNSEVKRRPTEVPPQNELEYCQSDLCIVKTFGIPLPEPTIMPAHIQFDDSPCWYHTTCMGLSLYQFEKALKDPNSKTPTVTYSRQIENVKREYYACIERLQKLKEKRAKLEEKYRPKELSATFYSCLEKLGASRKAWYENLTGIHARKIVTQIPKLIEMLKQNNIFNITGIPNIIDLLSSFGKIQSFTCSRKLTDSECEEVVSLIYEFAEKIKTVMPLENTGQKLHMMLVHGIQQIRKKKDLGLLCEQGIESSHKEFNKLSQRIFTRDPLKRLEWMLKESARKTLINDKTGLKFDDDNEEDINDIN
ncbi:unnamed protein product [Bursaphelenchus okinawaensis]|uniref:Uncharacterized protein n=1 Tax=Bursaphelenchus okinawaensis TaxID=465554 RepID=A0A811LM89_9BILA|nr:unnamed protein product [Bursaphelenchus okinawaensis]CAG9127931.1 unnamed protein product [Bursaphelenchus okinawaensis]